MKKFFIILIAELIFLCVSIVSVTAQTDGAWELLYKDKDGTEVQMVNIIVDGYFSTSVYRASDGAFINTWGGKISTDGNSLTRIVEFNANAQEEVGKEYSKPFTLAGDELTIEDGKGIWKRIDSGTPGALFGAWLITGRKRGGEISRRTPGARKTMKILSGTRFQWIAYNTDDGGFFGTGGGTYTTENGKYVENIEFFSRDDSRVGAALSFDYEINNGEWHHSGLSSKGDPIYEIWTARGSLEP